VTGQPTILIAEDNDVTRTFMERPLTAAGYEIVGAPNVEEGRRVIETHALDLALIDLGLGIGDGRELLALLREVAPDVPAVIVTSDNTATTAVDLIRSGAFDYVVKPVDIDNLLNLVARGIELCAARRALGNLRDVIERGGPSWDVGETPRMKTVEQLVNKFAPTNASVLIEGESGTGKEVVARALHNRSKRASGPFIAINCAALPGQLLESELFGHEKGSFTGAVATQRGLLELADGGTLFLDEVTMMSPEMQAKLLRTLQEFKVRRVGGQKEIKIDVRVISASNRRVLDAIAAGEFREDLYFRLCVITLELPSLRQRAVDIPFFVEKFLREMREATGTSVTAISDAALWALNRYRWTGNIRELHNVIERAVILATGEATIDVVHLPEIVRSVEIGGNDGGNGRGGNSRGHLPTVLPTDGLDLKALESDWERSLVEQALLRTDGNQSGAARLLGLTRDELRYRVDKFGINSSD
jgi:two-component system, NtrC family, response regulator AtoC